MSRVANEEGFKMSGHNWTWNDAHQYECCSDCGFIRRRLVNRQVLLRPHENEEPKATIYFLSDKDGLCENINSCEEVRMRQALK
jgi:hypothetical protein